VLNTIIKCLKVLETIINLPKQNTEQPAQTLDSRCFFYVDSSLFQRNIKKSVKQGNQRLSRLPMLHKVLISAYSSLLSYNVSNHG